MFPYFNPASHFVLGGVEISLFEFILSMALAIAVAFALYRARSLGISALTVLQATALILPLGLFSAHALNVVMYKWYLLGEPGWIGLLLHVEGSKSSFGGLIGALFGLVLYTELFSQRHLRLPLLDLCLEACVVAVTVGRIGCALTHDHIGAATTFPLAVYLPGGPRHDLGLYEFLLLLLVVLPTALYVQNRRFPAGVTAGIILALYGALRFPLDFLRVEDSRILSLTPAQFCCVFCILAGAVLVRTCIDRGKGELKNGLVTHF